jgi:hypothetical protein
LEFEPLGSAVFIAFRGPSAEANALPKIVPADFSAVNQHDAAQAESRLAKQWEAIPV